MAGDLSPYSLPTCDACGWVAPRHQVSFEKGLFLAGPVDWRSYPEFRCGCRIVWEAQRKGLVDEACGGHGTGPWTIERFLGAKLEQAAASL